MNKMFFSSLFFAAALGLLPAAAATLNKTTTLIDQRAAAPQNIIPSGPHFARVIDDLPLMDGLAPRPEEDMLFVTPAAGRIAETTAEGTVDIDDVYKFYRRSLPHLGWMAVDGRTYRRDGELLRIDARAAGKLTTVQFSVTPNAAGR